MGTDRPCNPRDNRRPERKVLMYLSCLAIVEF